MTEPPSAPGPGFVPLSDMERAALRNTVRCVVIEIRQTIAQRLQRGEPLTSVEGDLAPLVHDRIAAVNQVLALLDPSKAFTAAAAVAWLTVFEAVRGDVTGFRQLLAVAQQSPPPAGAPERP